MKLVNKNDFLKKSTETLGEICEMFKSAPVIKFNELQSEKTAFVIVDMINGFARVGALMSPRVEEVIPEITELSMKCDELKITKIAFADCHTNASPEFESYPAHCIGGTSEGEIVDEIKKVGGYTLISKNSTNGFLEAEFKKWLEENKQINTFIIAGDCTDICIVQFAVTIKTWFNMQNMKSRIIVPLNVVETYDLGNHNGDLMNIMALYSMTGNGVEVVKRIEA